MIKYLIFCLALSLLTACSMKTNTPSTNRSNTLSVDSNALNSGILEVSLPEKHPKNLSIKTPNDEWYILQDPSVPVAVIPQAKFESTLLLELDVRILKGIVWRNGEKIEDLVFSVNGEYFIYFADNLETEPENTFSMGITVDFEGE